MSYQCEHDDEFSLRILGRNLSVGGALCAAHQIGFDPPVRWWTIAESPTMLVRVPNTWYPGCSWPADKPDDGWEP